MSNERMVDDVCDEYIEALKEKYISVAKVFSIVNKPDMATKGLWTSSRRLPLNIEQMNDILLSSNVPTGDIDIILLWADQITQLTTSH